MNRRNLLASLGVLTLGGPTAAADQSDENNENDENCEPVEVVVGEDADGEITEEVPRAWQEHVERTEEAHEEIEAEYGN
ncbi:MAG: hypothetical protein IH933_11825 [Euryarchaeota archaeon]|nr:hypothetical protein [Euryarchaeota archaeon]